MGRNTLNEFMAATRLEGTADPPVDKAAIQGHLERLEKGAALLLNMRVS